MAPLCYAAKFDPFLSLDCTPHALHAGAIQGKEGIKSCRLVTLLESRDGAMDGGLDAQLGPLPFGKDK